MKPNFLDQAIGFFNPKAGAERLKSRAVMSAMQHYDAAGRSKRTQGYKAPSGDVNSTVRGAERMRNIARDMVRNNAIARRATTTLVDNIVGDGIIPSVEAESDADKRRIEEILLEHIDTTAIDAAGRMDLYGVQRLAVESMIVSGETLIRRRVRYPSDTVSKLPFQIECLEPEQIDSRVFGKTDSGNAILDGIEFDELKRRIAYNVFTEHPEDTLSGYPSASRVTAANMIHLYRMERPGQRRGMSWLAPAIPLMADAYDYADAQLVKQKVSAMWVGFTRDPDGSYGDQEDAQDKATKLYPGMFEHLPGNREVTFASPPPADGYSEHMKSVMRMIAASLNITYEELSGDLEGVNFSSARIGRISMQRAISSAQWTTVIPSLCLPLTDWIKQGFANHPERIRGEWGIKWTPPRFPMTDPSREIPAILHEIGGGLTSRQRKIREMGYDPEQIYREIAEDKASAEALGLIFSDAPEIPEERQN